MEFSRIADKKRLQFIIDAISKNVPAGEEVLDIGCGNGIITIAVGKSGFNVTGIDSSRKTIEAARSSNYPSNVKFMVVAAGEFAVQPGKFAAIVCSEVLEHLEDPGDLLRILHASLNKNGILIITVPNGKGPRELLVTRPVQYLQRKNNIIWKFVSILKMSLGYKGTTVQSSADDLTHIQFFTRPSLERLAKSHGFEITTFKKSNFIEQVFPFSLFFKRSSTLQKLDCKLADWLPPGLTSGFMMVWRKK
jgi:2-polyprenyl-3-methyl-5-hydroxy-6-metoxy-1,4-benzoquinol methylase